MRGTVVVTVVFTVETRFASLFGTNPRLGLVSRIGADYQGPNTANASNTRSPVVRAHRHAQAMAREHRSLARSLRGRRRIGRREEPVQRGVRDEDAPTDPDGGDIATPHGLVGKGPTDPQR